MKNDNEKNNQLIIKELLNINAYSADDLAMVKRKISKLKKIPCSTNIALLKAYHNLVKEKSIAPNKNLEKLLTTRPVRSLSGVVNVSVLTKPYPCPGNCLYCPNTPNFPRSYLPGEPAAERAKKLNFDPYLQIQKRLEMLSLGGHPTDKIEVRIIGATWSAYPKKYQVWFCKKIFDACNQDKNNSNDKKLSEANLWKKLKIAQKKNEKAKHRIVALSFETRPDYIDIKEAERMRQLGATKIELGVQAVDDNILKQNQRGHGVKEIIQATQILKNFGFKVSYQMMLNLYDSSPEKDIQMFQEIFNNPDFKPDCLKIYPCALVKQAALYQKYQQGKYRPYSKEVLINTLKAIKKITPRYVRIERIIRDIPSPLIVEGGTKISNLRQVLEQEMQKENWHCQCIRCREVQNKKENEKISLKNIYLFQEDYEASNGKEILLTFEDKKRKYLYSLLRLRLPFQNILKFYSSTNSFPSELKKTALIRELHTYGPTALINKKNAPVQHRGLGKKLIYKAEKIAKQAGYKKIAIISGAGVRDYYRRLGYRLKNGYMIKLLKS